MARLVAPDDQAHPRVLAERQVTDRLALGARPPGDAVPLDALGLAPEADREVPRLGLDDPHRDAEDPRGERDRRPLGDHREGHDDEHDPVDAAGLVDVVEDGEGGEEDRDSALEAAPDDEQSLADSYPRGQEEGAGHE